MRVNQSVLHVVKSVVTEDSVAMPHGGALQKNIVQPISYLIHVIIPPICNMQYAEE